MLPKDRKEVSECGLVHVLDVVWSSKGQQKLESALATLVGNNEVELEPEDDETKSPTAPSSPREPKKESQHW